MVQIAITKDISIQICSIDNIDGMIEMIGRNFFFIALESVKNWKINGRQIHIECVIIIIYIHRQ